MKQSISEILAVVTTLGFISADHLIDWFARHGYSWLYWSPSSGSIDLAGFIEFFVAGLLIWAGGAITNRSWLANGALGAVGYGCLVLLSKWLLV